MSARPVEEYVINRAMHLCNPLGKIRLGVIKPKIITMDSVFALESEVSYQSFGLC